MAYRYYATEQPPKPWALPMDPRPTKVRDYGRREDTGHGFAAWGFVEYAAPLSDDDVEAYGLRRAK